MSRLPTVFLSHGGGPWPWMPEARRGVYATLAASLRDLTGQIGMRPRAILMVSAHWESAEFTVQTHPNPPMLYDYDGFPEHTYRVRYAAPGSPALAARTREALAAAGIASAEDAERGFDHGLFTPMAVAFPNADLPIVQLSLKRGLDPATHLRAGRTLAPLRDEGVLIIGSGLSYHDLRAFGPAGYGASATFDGWLLETMTLAGEARSARLTGWSSAPAARLAHPREEHLLPLMVAVGAAQSEVAERIYHETGFLGGLHVSSYRIGARAG